MTRSAAYCFVVCALAAAPLCAADVARVKTVTGSAHIERAGQRLPAMIDSGIQTTDTLITGTDGAVGITFLDNSRISAGPNSTVVINRYTFDQTTHAGSMDTTLRRGTLAVVSGRMVKQSPDAVTVRTSTMVLGVRGTEFLVHAE